MRRTERDDREFAEFMAARSHQLYRSAYLLTTSPHAAEDLLQTALAKAYAGWGRVRAVDDPVAYVHRVLLNSFLSDRRRRSSRELPAADLTRTGRADTRGQTTHRTDQTDHTDHTERLALMAALAELAPIDRAVVVLRFWEDRSIAQTALALDLTEAAVKNRSLRALRTLRVLLDDPTTLTHGSPS
ncbi:RNA polymerase sigma24 factor [Nocardioides psychrotolerans]|uniref:RNA polymerase sigma-70 factor, sigma-E family n=1 Tax=Nocardioides psychrotolerans TaxID=1005945 RepID=A0A1I3CEN4_9ACTN|nr:sigma-70 family RNA polymerase sigma factor [Nocardioides psychrotolerans]GEP39773.1 RNA polymerase sigma24 factor [Nocardioides psychrotolerans]SFH72541.1 RNA polymerase sigma-70 factor, sigma-E family [Nocardioides psychrotolerans]